MSREGVPIDPLAKGGLIVLPHQIAVGEKQWN